MEEEEDSACEIRSSGTSVTPDRLSDRKWRNVGMYSGLSSPISDVRYAGASRPDSAIESQCSRQMSQSDLRCDSFASKHAAHSARHVSTGTEDASDDQLSTDSPLPVEEEQIVPRHVSYHDHDDCGRHCHSQWTQIEPQDSPEIGGSDDEYILKQMPIQQAASVVQVQILEQAADSDLDTTGVSVLSDQPDDLSQFRSRLSNLLDRSNRRLISDSAATLLPFEQVHDPNVINSNRDSLPDRTELASSSASYPPISSAIASNVESPMISVNDSNAIVTLSEEEFAQRTSALRQRIHNTFQLLCSIGAADGSELRKLAASRAQSRAQCELELDVKPSSPEQASQRPHLSPHSPPHSSPHTIAAQPPLTLTSTAQPESGARYESRMTEEADLETNLSRTNNHHEPSSGSCYRPSIARQVQPETNSDCRRPSSESMPATARRPPRPPPPPQSKSSATVRRRSTRSVLPDTPFECDLLRTRTSLPSVPPNRAFNSTSGWIDDHHSHPLLASDRHLHQRYVQSSSPNEYTDLYERHECTYPSGLSF
jgi:hypothetical protein